MYVNAGHIVRAKEEPVCSRGCTGKRRSHCHIGLAVTAQERIRGSYDSVIGERDKAAGRVAHQIRSADDAVPYTMHRYAHTCERSASDRTCPRVSRISLQLRGPTTEASMMVTRSDTAKI